MPSRDNAQYLSFFIGGDEYGLALLDSREILQSPAISTVPSMSRAVRGITSLRGRVIPVVDLAVVLGHAARPTDKWSCVVVVDVSEGATTTVGLLVDAIHRVFEVPADQIEPPPALGTRGRPQVLRGVAVGGGSFVRLLELARVIEQVDVEPVELAAPDDAVEAAGSDLVSEAHDLDATADPTMTDSVDSEALRRDPPDEPASAELAAEEPSP